MFPSQDILFSFDKEDQKKLAKLKITNLFSLVLLHTPKSYTHTALIPTLDFESSISGVLRVRITQVRSTGFGKNAMLHIDAQMLDFDERLHIVIFHAKIFHRKLFALDSEIYIMGKLELKFDEYMMTQPTIVKEINTIRTHFKTTLFNAKTMQQLTQRLITQKNLLTCGLPLDIACKIEEIFNPTKVFLQAYNISGNAFPKDSLDALKFVEIYHYLQNLSCKKRHFPANFVCKGCAEDFIRTLPFDLTNGQKDAIKDIQKDLTRSIAAKRLVMGDVGCGKTIVILCAVMIAYPYKSILMAPTTILARQLYQEAQKFLPHYVKVQLITSQSKATFDDEAHFIIGTQALLYRDLKLENLALVMSDEQHRFGTIQRYKLEKISSDSDSKDLDSIESARLTESPKSSPKKRPHVLQFSATPIPRTLAMLNAQLIDFSFIRDLPFKKEILTRIVGKNDFSSLFMHLRNEIAQGHQAIIVYPLVEESQSIDYASLSEGSNFWQKHFEGVFITSGKDKEKQEVIDTFREKGSILLATTVIEVGISLPRVSTIVIVAPERLGLATLHQLRGRVSRNGLKGYCYLYTHSLNDERLKAFASTLSGFKIAELDLKYRNSGDLLSGDRQSGDVFIYVDMRSDEDLIQHVQNLLHTPCVERLSFDAKEISKN